MDETWRAAREGRGAIALHPFDPGPHGPEGHVTPAALVEGDVVGAVEAALGRRVGASLDRFALFALKAGHEALGEAGLIGAPALERRAAVVFGHGFGGLTTLEASYERFYGQKARFHPLSVPKVMVSAPVSAVAMEFGVRGPVFAVSSACSSSGHAIAQGAAMIASGQVDIALAGGSEAIATPGLPARLGGPPGDDRDHLPAVFYRARRHGHRRGRRRPWCWRRWITPGRAAPPSWASWPAWVCPPTPSTGPSPAWMARSAP